MKATKCKNCDWTSDICANCWNKLEDDFKLLRSKLAKQAEIIERCDTALRSVERRRDPDFLISNALFDIRKWKKEAGK